jgi:hypothetical protein
MVYFLYDAEVKNLIANGTTRLKGYTYANGWRDYEGLGISVVSYCLFDHSRFMVQTCVWDNPIDKDMLIGYLAQSTKIIGFNTKAFDDNLLRANGLEVYTNYDLLEEIRIAAYGSPSFSKQPKGTNYSLGIVAKANGLFKTGNGELAPQLWQEGSTREVMAYCENDAKITYQLLMLGLQGKLIDPNTQKLLKLRSLRT